MVRVISRSDAGVAKEDLLREALDASGIDTETLYAILETVDLKDRPPFHVEACHITVTGGNVDEGWPSHIREIVDDGICTRVLWVSKQVVDGENARFLWLCAHELRHHLQEQSGDPTGPANDLLRACSSRLGLKDHLSIPAELDAEIGAKRVYLALRGQTGYDSFRNEDEGYYDRLDEAEAAWSGSLEDETKRVFRDHKRQIEKCLARLQRRGSFRSFDLAQWIEAS